VAASPAGSTSAAALLRCAAHHSSPARLPSIFWASSAHTHYPARFGAARPGPATGKAGSPRGVPARHVHPIARPGTARQWERGRGRAAAEGAWHGCQRPLFAAPPAGSKLCWVQRTGCTPLHGNCVARATPAGLAGAAAAVLAPAPLLLVLTPLLALSPPPFQVPWSTPFFSFSTHSSSVAQNAESWTAGSLQVRPPLVALPPPPGVLPHERHQPVPHAQSLNCSIAQLLNRTVPCTLHLVLMHLALLFLAEAASLCALLVDGPARLLRA